MLLEIQLRNISVQTFQEMGFTQTDTVEVIAGHLSRELKVFATGKHGFFSSGFEFTAAKRKGRTDLTISMELNDAATARFASSSEAATADIKNMEAATSTTMKLKPEYVSINAPSLRKD